MGDAPANYRPSSSVHIECLLKLPNAGNENHFSIFSVLNMIKAHVCHIPQDEILSEGGKDGWVKQVGRLVEVTPGRGVSKGRKFFVV